MLLSNEVSLNSIYLGLQNNRWWDNNSWGGLKSKTETNTNSDNIYCLNDVHKYGSITRHMISENSCYREEFLRYHEGELKKKMFYRILYSPTDNLLAN
jgi:hypothetical protein